MNELAALIWDRKGDASFEDLARRSGGAIDSKTLQKWGNTRTGHLRSLPAPETLNGIAAAIGTSVDLVAVAALRAAGVRVRERFGATAPPLRGFDGLTERQQRALEHLVDAMAEPHGSAELPATPSAEPDLVHAGHLIADALRDSGLRPRLAADVARIPRRLWQHMLDGQEDATDEEWFAAAIVARADPDAVFAALRRPVPVGDDPDHEEGLQDRAR